MPMSSTRSGGGEGALQRECMRLQIRGHFGSAYAKRHPLLPGVAAALRPCSSGLAPFLRAIEGLPSGSASRLKRYIRG